MNEGCKTLPVQRRRDGGATCDSDAVAVEEPLEIRINGKPVCVTMRTPGHDADLVAGFLFTEGVVSRAALPEMKTTGANVIDIAAGPRSSARSRRLQSRFFVSTSCGLCGRAGVAQIRRKLGSIRNDAAFPAALLTRLPWKMRSQQEIFRATGGLHAAALFDGGGNLLSAREDVGRHNAVDKAVGGWLRQSARAADPVLLLVSGRASFEIVQKALAAKIPIVAAVSAPSSLAVELARETGITLIAFLRARSFNIYSRADRIRWKRPL